MKALPLLLLVSGCAAPSSALYRQRCAPLWAYIHDDRVDFDGLQKDPQRAACDAALAETDPRAMAVPERIAFWVNAYNLAMLSLVADEPARWSAKQDGTSLFVRRVHVGRRHLTPDEIEHGELATLNRDPRIEFVLSCATRGCALLPPHLLSGADLPASFAEGERRFFQRRWNVEVVRSLGLIYTSQLIAPDWHGQDFVRAGERIEAVVARHLSDEDARLLLSGKLRLHFRPYDWRVNRMPTEYGVF